MIISKQHNLPRLLKQWRFFIVTVSRAFERRALIYVQVPLFEGNCEHNKTCCRLGYSHGLFFSFMTVSWHGNTYCSVGPLCGESTHHCWIPPQRPLMWNSYGFYVVRLKKLWRLQWRHNEHNGVSNHRRLHCLLNRLFRCKRNIKAPRHWPLWGEFNGDRWIPRTNFQ